MSGAAAILLCAGASTRMGRAKALIAAGHGPIGPETFLRRQVRIAREAGADPVVAVIAPPHGPAIRAAHDDLATPVTWADNPRPEEGMLSSVQAGVRLLPADVRGTLVWPVDLPFVAPDTVRLILAAALGQAQQYPGPALVIPTHRGRGGHPIWVLARHFAELLALPPALGLRELRRRHQGEIALLEVCDEAILRDIDTPADLAAWRSNSR